MTECKHDLKIMEDYIFCKECGKRWFDETCEHDVTPDFNRLHPNCTYTGDPQEQYPTTC